MRPLKISCAAIVDDDGRTLLVRKANTDFYMQPGGKIEPGETPLAALKRELMEELGVAVPDAQMRYLGTFSEVAANEPDVMLARTFFSSGTICSRRSPARSRTASGSILLATCATILRH